MKRTAKTAIALLLSAGLAMSGFGFSSTDGGATIFGGASGCCRATA